MSLRQQNFLSIFFTYPDSFSSVAILVALLVSPSVSLFISFAFLETQIHTLNSHRPSCLLPKPAFTPLFLLHPPLHLDSHPREFDICTNHAFSCSLFLMLWCWGTCWLWKDCPQLLQTGKDAGWCVCPMPATQSRAHTPTSNFMGLLHPEPLLFCPNNPRARCQRTRDNPQISGLIAII